MVRVRSTSAPLALLTATLLLSLLLPAAPLQAGQEPAFARGYADGYDTGAGDAARGERYDPVSSPAYRDGDAGYTPEYGSREAYRTNYRAGFRQGYDDGYRGRRTRY